MFCAVLRDRVQATRWRSDSAVLPGALSSRTSPHARPPEGHDILLVDRITQTNPFVTALYLPHFARTRRARTRQKFKHRHFSVNSVVSSTVSLVALRLLKFVLPAFERSFFFFLNPCTNTDKQATGKHPEWYHAQ